MLTVLFSLITNIGIYSATRMLNMLEQFVMQTCSCIAEARKKGDVRLQQSSTGEVGI